MQDDEEKRKLQSQVLNYEKGLKPIIKSLHFNLHSVLKNKNYSIKIMDRTENHIDVRKTKDRIKVKEKET